MKSIVLTRFSVLDRAELDYWFERAETSGRDPRAWAYLVSRLASARVEALGPLRGPGSTSDAETPESRPLRRENGVP